MKVCFHSALRASFSSGVRCSESALISPYGCPQCVVGTLKSPCGTAVTSPNSRCLTQESVPVLFCSGSGTHFYLAQNGLRMDYGLITNYGDKTANGSLT